MDIRKLECASRAARYRVAISCGAYDLAVERFHGILDDISGDYLVTYDSNPVFKNSIFTLPPPGFPSQIFFPRNPQDPPQIPLSLGGPAPPQTPA